MLGRATPLRDASGDVVKWFGTYTDIYELKQAQVRIAEQAQLLDLARDAILVEDLDHNVVYWNHGAELAFGWSATEASGHRLDKLISRDRDQIEAALTVVHERGEWSGELQCTDKTNAVRLLQSRWTLLLHADGTPKGVLAVNTDVTERRATQAQFILILEAQATHDPLTGLPNRALLTDRLDKAAAASPRDRTPLALLFVDLDNFKEINDGAGHLLGDKVLAEAASRLASVLRRSDTVARFGGDEFAVIQPGPVEPNGGAEVARRISEALMTPFDLDGASVTLAVSIGIAMAPEHGDCPGELVRKADLALYRAKQSKGTGLNYRVFEPAMEDGPAVAPGPAISVAAGARLRQVSRGGTRGRP